jgi:hypothetical protein
MRYLQISHRASGQNRLICSQREVRRSWQPIRSGDLIPTKKIENRHDGFGEQAVAAARGTPGHTDRLPVVGPRSYR